MFDSALEEAGEDGVRNMVELLEFCISPSVSVRSSSRPKHWLLWYIRLKNALVAPTVQGI
jgi:hypothetical protein